MVHTISQKGTVYLIGAGPGDPALLTLKAKACLEQADIVIYDYLANPRLLEYVRPEAERVYVGKQAGQHTKSQEEITALLVESAHRYKHVARLKGGDPFLFGRGGEEALELVTQQIPFEVVPGISSGLAAPAYAGIPVTHRDMASSVAFITGHEAQKDADSAHVDWAKIAHSCDTLVIFMGVKNLPHIAEKLMTAGLSRETPVALIHRGTYPSQYTLTGTLETIVQQAEAAHFRPPAIIVVGRVAALHEQLTWFEKRPLFGKTIAVTRNAASENTLIHLLEAQGAEVVHFPTIEIVEIEPNQELEAAFAALDTYDWLLFTSGNGVEIFFRRLFAHGYDIRALHRINIAAIGNPSAAKLQAYHLNADVVPDQFTSDALVSALTAQVSRRGARILFPGSNLSNPDIARRLQEAGAEVNALPVYATRQADLDAAMVAAFTTRLQAGEIDWITFTSSSTVHNFVQLLGRDVIAAQSASLSAASIGPVTTDTLKEYGIVPDITADEHTFAGLVNAILMHVNKE